MRLARIPQGDRYAVANTGDSPATILKYYAKLLEVVMRRFVENQPMIPGNGLKGNTGITVRQRPSCRSHADFTISPIQSKLASAIPTHLFGSCEARAEHGRWLTSQSRKVTFVRRYRGQHASVATREQCFGCPPSNGGIRLPLRGPPSAVVKWCLTPPPVLKGTRSCTPERSIACC
jgi:hypothetical protein